MTGPCQYRKKPVVIEAWRFDHDAEDVMDLVTWCGGSYVFNANTGADIHLEILTLEGKMRADPGDYVIRGVKGEFYPCKPDIFDASYEAVE